MRKGDDVMDWAAVLSMGGIAAAMETFAYFWSRSLRKVSRNEER